MLLFLECDSQNNFEKDIVLVIGLSLGQYLIHIGGGTFFCYQVKRATEMKKIFKSSMGLLWLLRWKIWKICLARSAFLTSSLTCNFACPVETGSPKDQTASDTLSLTTPPWLDENVKSASKY
jgi:hypothetical protein